MRNFIKFHLLLLLASPLAWSEEKSLEKITVNSQSLEDSVPQKIGDYGSKLEIISSSQIKSSGATDATKALQMLAPGLYLSPKNGAFDYTTASLQGARSQDILWLVDGIRINNRLYASTSPLDTIPASIIERIEILKGGQGIFYGTQAISGVVNIVTHSLSSDDSGRINLGINSNDGRSLSAKKSGGSNKHQYLVFADSSQAKGFQPYKNKYFEDSATDRKRGYDIFTVGGKYGYSFSNDHKISVFYQRNEANLDFAQPTDNFKTQNERIEDLAYIKLDSQLTNSVKLLAKTYYHNWDTRYTKLHNVPGDNKTLAIKSNNDYWGYEDYGLNLATEIQGNQYLDYTLGYDFQNFSGKDDVLLIGKKTESVHSAFAQIATKSSWLQDTAISLGTRYNKPSGNGDKLVSQLSAVHHLSLNQYIRTNTGSSFRLPSAYELYAIDSCCSQGNSDLEPETGVNFNLAWGLSFEQYNIEIAGFKRKIDNLIQSAIPAGSTDTVKVFENSNNEVNFEGLELNLAAQFNEQYQIKFNHVYSSAKEKGSDKQVNDIPRNHSKLNIIFKPNVSDLKLSLSANHVGDIWDEELDQRINYGNYTFVDLTAELSIDTKKQHQVSLTLENVTNTDYATSIKNAKRDADDSAYIYENRGTPFTAHLNYSYSF